MSKKLCFECFNLLYTLNIFNDKNILLLRIIKYNNKHLIKLSSIQYTMFDRLMLSVSPTEQSFGDHIEDASEEEHEGEYN